MADDGDQVMTEGVAETPSTSVDNPPFAEVRYAGEATRREISEETWLKNNVAGQNAVTWDKHNNFLISADHFTPEAIAVLRRDSNFLFV